MGMIRVALAMAVVLSHLPMASFKFLSGGLAVQSFFIISGFYMSLVLSGKYADTGLFYSNRLLRLFPTYFVVFALTAIAVFVFNGSATASPDLLRTMFSDPVTAATLIFTNLTMLGQDLLFWFSIDPNGALVFDSRGPLPDENTVVGWQGLLVPQAWSLSMELMFYALAPLLARLSWRWIAAIALASIALRLAGHWLSVDYLLWQGRFFPTALFLFLLGMLGHRAMPWVERLPKAVGMIAFAALMAFIVGFTFLNWTATPWRWAVYAIVALTTPFIFHAFRANAIDRWIGELSYPIYMTQLLVIGLVLTKEPPFGMWIGIFGTVALSALVLLLIDHPIDRWRQRRAGAPQSEPAAAPGAASAAPL
ncbi:MAG: acyltransferase family protein [Hyphomonadaceae bacterium]